VTGGMVWHLIMQAGASAGLDYPYRMDASQYQRSQVWQGGVENVKK
jgi:hypothetical protein